MVILKTVIFGAAFCLSIASPQSNVRAYGQYTNNDLFTFPTPSVKPTMIVLDDNGAFYNERQAMVAALGMYLGVKEVVPPRN